MVIFEHEKLMQRLAAQRPIFHSEADFQHALAIEIWKMYPDVQLRLEVPVGQDDRADIDVLLRKNNEQFALELKYSSHRFKGEICGEQFDLRGGRARDHFRYDVCKDIFRIEQFCQHRAAAGGVVVLTNESAYWEPRRHIDTDDAAFNLTDAIELNGALAWAVGTEAAKGSRKAQVALVGSYAIRWRDYSIFDLPFEKLRYLYIEIGSQ